jgi:hypothetical protein
MTPNDAEKQEKIAYGRGRMDVTKPFLKRIGKRNFLDGKGSGRRPIHGDKRSDDCQVTQRVDQKAGALAEFCNDQAGQSGTDDSRRIDH